MTRKTTSTHDDPMVNTVVHKLLVATDRLQAIPAAGVAFIITVAAVVIGLLGDDVTGVVYAVTALTNWLLLWLLPRVGRSYGPDRPSALALAAVFGVVVALLQVLMLPWWVAALMGAALIVLVFYSTWVEPFRLGVTHQQYIYPGFSGEHRLRLLHISDIHVERITARERRVNKLVRELQPDVIVFSGDFINISYTHDAQALADIREVIAEWSAPYGVFCVPGTYTVEPIERVRAFTDGLRNLRLLEDEWVCVETPAGSLNILGMVTTHRLSQDRETVKALAQFAPDAAGLKLLLTHAPDVAPEADAAGYDLYLCGHTHGGQLRFPLIGAVVSGSALGMRYVMGRYALEHLTVYTSRGVGLEGLGAPRARFLCPPEIVLWEITGLQAGR